MKPFERSDYGNFAPPGYVTVPTETPEQRELRRQRRLALYVIGAAFVVMIAAWAVILSGALPER